MSGVCLGTADLHSASVHHVLLETIEQNLSDEVFNEEIESESVDLSVFFQAIFRCFARAEKAISEPSVWDNDVWISTFPKRGTTLTQQIFWN